MHGGPMTTMYALFAMYMYLPIHFTDDGDGDSQIKKAA